MRLALVFTSFDWDHEPFRNLTHGPPRVTVEAMFYIYSGNQGRGNGDCGKGADIYDGPKCEDYARAAHRKFLQTFNLQERQVPLLKLDLWNWDYPFSPDQAELYEDDE